MDGRCVYLHQTLHELGSEAGGATGFRFGRSPAALQELVGPLRCNPGALEQKEFLLQPEPSIQQPVPFAQPVPEVTIHFLTFLDGTLPQKRPYSGPEAETRAERTPDDPVACRMQNRTY